jgi:hemolysin III
MSSRYWTDGPARIFKDPVSGLTHLAGAALAAIGLVYLLGASRGKDAATVAAVAIYGASMVLLYLSSATYHLLHVDPPTRARLRRIDHAMVPVFIAGTYTPFCLVTLRGPTGTAILAVVWTLALAGLFKSLFWLHAPRWVTAGLFVIMGWIIIFAASPLAEAASTAQIVLLFAGGVAYTLGAAIYARKWPDPWPNVFGFHEIWHLFVLGGSALHFACVLTLLA